MPVSDFSGKDRLIAALDAAIAQPTASARVDAIRDTLEQLVRERAFVLPEHLLQPVADHYARRELHASGEHGYSVVAMTWAPGQGTPVHDHDGGWCVEATYQGELEVDEYALLERDGEHYRFGKIRHLRSLPGNSDSLLEAQQFHRIRNPDSEAVAVSLHIYPRPLQRFSAFEPQPERGPDWYRCHERRLGMD